MKGLAEKLHTDLDRGLTPVDFEERQGHFGSNYKAPPKRTPFCRLFMGALEDFMLRLLLVCACISMVFDEAFAHGDTKEEIANERKVGKRIH